MAGNAAFGVLADRFGHRIVLMSGVAAGIVSNVAALVAPSPGAFAAVFAFTGIQLAAVNVSGLNVLLEFAPAVDERPTYIGLGTTLLAPVVFAVPLLGGLMADALGFGAVFCAAAAGGLVALGLLVGRVRDPRH